jgi:hypothetical protein
MKCPQCSTEMDAGTTNVTWSTVAGILEFAGAFFGDGPGSQQYLYFYPERGGETVCVFSGTQKAFRCPQCQTVVISPAT